MVAQHSGVVEKSTQRLPIPTHDMRNKLLTSNTTISQNLMNTSCMTIKQALIYHYYHSIQHWERYQRYLLSVTSQLPSISHLIMYIKYQQIMTRSTDNKTKYYAPPTQNIRLLRLCYRLVHEILLLCGYWSSRGLIIACTFWQKNILVLSDKLWLIIFYVMFLHILSDKRCPLV